MCLIGLSPFSIMRSNVGAQWVSKGVQPLVDPYIERFELQPIGNMGFTWNGELIKVSEENLLSCLPFSKKAKDDFVEASKEMASDAELLYRGRSWDRAYDLQPDELWRKLEKQAIAEYLSPYHPDVTTLWGARVKGGFGGGPDEVSAYFLVAWYMGSPWFPMSIIKGGNHLLGEAILDGCRKAGARLVLGSEVTEAVQDEKTVRVRCADGQEFSSEYAIVTVTADVANDTVRGLSDKKREALAAVEYVTLTQLGVQVENIPSAEELAGVLFIGGRTAAYVCQTGSIAGYPGTGNVISASITDQDMVGISDSEAVAAIAEDLKMVSKDFDIERDILEYVIKRWKVGEVHMSPGFLSKYRDLLKEPAGNIYFAGDYVSDFPVWGGAVWSGTKAAGEIMEAAGRLFPVDRRPDT